MTSCRHCGVPVEPVPDTKAVGGARWVHLSDRSVWCRMTSASPDGSLPSDVEIRELLELGWSVSNIAKRWRVSRRTLADHVRIRGIRPTPTNEGTPAA